VSEPQPTGTEPAEDESFVERVVDSVTDKAGDVVKTVGAMGAAFRMGSKNAREEL
jgi:hypothetical protein